MKTTIYLLVASAILALSSCATSESSGTASRGVTPYKSDMCALTDNKLGSMGDPVTIVHAGQELKFCCKPCVKKFNDNPDKYLKAQQTQ